MILIGIAAAAVVLGLSVVVAVCASLVGRRADASFEPAAVDALAPPPLPDEPLVPARRFARDPSGRPIAEPVTSG